MRLYLVQHGEAVPEDVDPARPLSATGRSDVAKAARFLATGGLRVPQVLHSGKLRAEQTAALLAAALAPGRAPVARPGLNPKDATDEVARAVTAWDQDAMLVGHLPFMAKLVKGWSSGARMPAWSRCSLAQSYASSAPSSSAGRSFGCCSRTCCRTGPDRLGIFRTTRLRQ